MAPADRAGSAAFGASNVIAVACLLALMTALQPRPVWAADPTASGAPSSPPICAERYPADGPAGIDLLLGCIVNEVMQSYLGAGSRTASHPPRFSQWFGQIAAGVALVVGLFVLLRAIRRSAGRRLAPAAPIVWWECRDCRSLNAAGTPACYRCGQAFVSGGTEMRADAEPPAQQSFGRRDDL